MTFAPSFVRVLIYMFFLMQLTFASFTMVLWLAGAIDNQSVRIFSIVIFLGITICSPAVAIFQISVLKFQIDNDTIGPADFASIFLPSIDLGDIKSVRFGLFCYSVSQGIFKPSIIIPALFLFSNIERTRLIAHLNATVPKINPLVRLAR